MYGWLDRLATRSLGTGELDAWVTPDETRYLIIDPRRAPDAGRRLLGCEGLLSYRLLFATTPLAPLIEASPWCLQLVPDSQAWQTASTLCQEQALGWCFQPAPDLSLETLTEHLRSLFIWQASQGGHSLISVQSPVALTALLASAGTDTLARVIGPLGRVVLPTPQQRWQAWQFPPQQLEESLAFTLTQDMERTLSESHSAWWLSQTLDQPMHDLPLHSLACLAELKSHGITLPRHHQALLPFITQVDWLARSDVQATLASPSPAWKKVRDLQSLATIQPRPDRETDYAIPHPRR